METVQIALQIPRSALSSMRQEPDEFAQEMRRAAAVKWYEMQLISQSKAAEIAGVSRSEFFDLLSRFHVSPFQYEVQEVLGELRNE